MKCGGLFFFMVLLACCKSQAPHSEIEQGIQGEVWWLEGDFMPRIGESPPGQRTPVRREVIVYPVVKIEELKEQIGPVFSAIPREKVASVESGIDGKFEVMLPEGTYSVFTKEPDGYFANSFDGEGRINSVTVKRGEMTDVVIDINYQATY